MRIIDSEVFNRNKLLEFLLSNTFQIDHLSSTHSKSMLCHEPEISVLMQSNRLMTVFELLDESDILWSDQAGEQLTDLNE